MKVFDLHTGEVVSLPPRMAPGRYRLLTPATLNATVKLKIGDVLWSDGGMRCNLSDEQGKTWKSTFEPISADHAKAWQSVDQGVLTVAQLVENTTDDLPAPLMPHSLTDFANLSTFEIELKRVLKAGHLHQISARPRMSMRYDSIVLPVSRARRLASGALERLASRSEDWHRRTLGGVEPARVLAEVSEDEWEIYENIVFARLIDQAILLINNSEIELTNYIYQQNKAIELSQAEDLHRQLREKLCQLWGQALDTKSKDANDTLKNTVKADDPLQTRLKELRKLGCRLRQLRFGPLYQAIPRSVRVPIALKNTNVLTHDPHYREMRELWRLAHQDVLENQTKPEEKIRQRMEQHKHYDTFVGLLTRHALKDCRTLKPSEHLDEWGFAGAKLTLQHSRPCEWLLSLAWPGGKRKTLTFLAAWSGQACWQESVERPYIRHEFQPVYCHSRSIEHGLTETGEDGVLNPLQFYAVERIKQRIENWLYQQVIALYPVEIPTMPTKTRDELLSKEPRAFVASNKGLKIVGNLKNLDVIELARSQGTNESTLEHVSWGLDLVATLEICRVCGEKAAPKIDLVQSTFWATCSCGYEWGVANRSGKREIVFRFKTKSDEEVTDFRKTGAWSLRQ
jgi:hypothetical protein